MFLHRKRQTDKHRNRKEIITDSQSGIKKPTGMQVDRHAEMELETSHADSLSS